MKFAITVWLICASLFIAAQAAERMAADGKLFLAGPFLDNGEMRGIFVFAVETLAEAEALTAADPAVESGRLSMELHPWYGSAALMKVGEIHSAVSRTSF